MSQSFLVDRPQSQRVLSTRWVPGGGRVVAHDDKMQADSQEWRFWELTSENENELQTARPTRSGVSVISNGNATDPLVTLPDRSCTGDARYKLDRPHYNVFERCSTWKQKAWARVKYMGDLLLLFFFFMHVAGHRAFNVVEESFPRT